MLAATKVTLRGSEKKANWNTYNISFMKRVNRRFHVAVKKEIYKKSVMHHLTFFLFLFYLFFRVFCRFRCRRRLALHYLIFCLSKVRVY